MSTFALFPDSELPAAIAAAAAQVPGLGVTLDYLSPEQEAALLEDVDAAPWLGDLARRVQHYGWRYGYRARQVDACSGSVRCPPGLLRSPNGCTKTASSPTWPTS